MSIERHRTKRSGQEMARFFSIVEVADALGLHPKTVRREVDRGRLKVHRIGRQIRISDEDYRAYVAIRRLAI